AVAACVEKRSARPLARCGDGRETTSHTSPYIHATPVGQVLVRHPPLPFVRRTALRITQIGARRYPRFATEVAMLSTSTSPLQSPASGFHSAPDDPPSVEYATRRGVSSRGTARWLLALFERLEAR